MYKYDSRVKSTCLICFEEIKETNLYHLFNETKICFSCMKKFKLLEKNYIVENCPTTILYHYNDFFKECLYHYKGLGDLALAPIFFHRHDFRKKYEDYIIVCVPSLEKENEVRGFAPIEELAKVFSNSIFTGLYKKEDIKQASSKNRSLSKENFEIENGECLFNQKVLILDDVYTSGTTLKACINLVKYYHPKQIETVILSLSPKSSLKESSLSFGDRIQPYKVYLEAFKNFVEEFLYKKKDIWEYTVSNHVRKE